MEKDLKAGLLLRVLGSEPWVHRPCWFTWTVLSPHWCVGGLLALPPTKTVTRRFMAIPGYIGSLFLLALSFQRQAFFKIYIFTKNTIHILFCDFTCQRVFCYFSARWFRIKHDNSPFLRETLLCIARSSLTMVRLKLLPFLTVVITAYTFSLHGSGFRSHLCHILTWSVISISEGSASS